MASMDVFKNSIFSMTSLSGFVNKMPHNPQYLGQLGLFEPKPVRTTSHFVEEQNGKLILIPTSERGGKSTTRTASKRKGRSFETVRLSLDSRITAEEVQNIRAAGTEAELKSVQAEVADRMSKMEQDHVLTEEHHRMGAINGLLLDADSTTVIEDFYDRFGITKPAAVDFAFSTATTNIRNVIKGVVRSIIRASKGAITPTSEIHALCGDEFYDALTSHPTVEKFFLNWQAAQTLQAQTGVFSVFYFEGVYWHNYRGTDDNSTVAIPTDECRFVIKGGREIFKHVMAPGEGFSSVNTLGQRRYADLVPDKDRSDPRFVDAFLEAYPLFINQRPDLLRSGAAS